MSDYTYEAGEKGMVLTGVTGEIVHSEVPKEVNGRPVVEIGKYAFSGQGQLQTIALPETIKKIGTHAFYNCRNLSSLTLTGDLSAVEDGAFKNCKKLKTVTMNGMVHLDLLLGNIPTEVTLYLHLADNTNLSLLFPEYDFTYQEFVQPRLYDLIEFGSGSHYRNALSATKINFTEYDAAFAHSELLDQPETSIVLALRRLASGYHLSESAAQKYKTFLSGHRMDAGKLVISRKDSLLLEALLNQELFSREELSELILFASDQDDPERVSMMMDFQLQHFGKKIRRFSL